MMVATVTPLRHDCLNTAKKRRIEMLYQMRQKIFSLGDDFVIKDKDGVDRFYVDGKVFAIGDKLSFQDMEGNELALIKQQILTFKKTYNIYRGDALAATVKKSKFTLFRDKFSVSIPGQNIHVQGNIFDHEYSFTRDNLTIATVSKSWFSFTDSYGIEIRDGEDDVLLLATAVVIDLCSHDNENR
jgi:uncharacterized protein YxjI